MFTSRRLLQSSLRDLFWLVFVAAVFTLWGMDHRQLARRIEALEKPTLALPSPYYQFDDVQYFPAGPEFPLSNDAATQKAYKTQEDNQRR